jgi:hypothetical protein
VRLLLDPGAQVPPGSLNHQAAKVDEALRQGARL